MKMALNLDQDDPYMDDLWTSTEFYQAVRSGCFIDYDGSGYYSDGKTYDRDDPAIPSVIYRHGIPEGKSYVVWFNK